MSTSAVYGIELNNGTVESTTVQFDGYVKNGVGEMLATHYTDRQKVKRLIEQGQCSVLRKNVGRKHSFDNDYDKANLKEWSTFYTRDRGERYQSNNVTNGRKVFATTHYTSPHIYLFTLDGTWVELNKYGTIHQNLTELFK